MSLIPLNGTIGTELRALARTGANWIDRRPVPQNLPIPTSRRTPTGASTCPVVLVHGFAHNRTAWPALEAKLREAGFDAVFTFEYDALAGGIRRGAERLGDFVHAVLTATGSTQVDIVGHSMGGLVGRYYAGCLDGVTRVRRLVTLGTPHAGTRIARIFPVPLRSLRQLASGSRLIESLSRITPTPGQHFTAIWSDGDELIHPHTSGAFEDGLARTESIRVGGIGHLAFLHHAGIAALVAETLSRPTTSAGAGARADAA
jgi:pimeloyl-ACP methyl ester carboxylesterase